MQTKVAAAETLPSKSVNQQRPVWSGEHGRKTNDTVSHSDTSRSSGHKAKFISKPCETANTQFPTSRPVKAVESHRQTGGTRPWSHLWLQTNRTWEGRRKRPLWWRRKILLLSGHPGVTSEIVGICVYSNCACAMGTLSGSWEPKPRHLHRPLVAGCSATPPLWGNIPPPKKMIFTKMISMILSCWCLWMLFFFNLFDFH